MNRNTFIPISTLLTVLIVTIHASDALSLDTSFSGDGKVTISFSAGDDVGSGIAVQFDDKIVVVGTSDDGSGTSQFAVARYLPDLSFSFNGGGGGGRLLHSNCGIWFAKDRLRTHIVAYAPLWFWFYRIRAVQAEV